ncbi:hypothetical protein [Frigidibacter sp.]|uniref:hypothetical protein n=1 Tax=Frigidibacter sp. TaxID=2586418 RepID=UPI0027355E49|nr:hypothetical protein [Frigidibacter sp.]MDP3341118.1 hypothetical protein [Frigidibacter sp.]
MTSLLILIGITGLTLIGDYCIKLASGAQSGLFSRTFVVGMVFYGLPAIGWFFLMRTHSLAAIGVLYSASTIILLAALGFFMFKEPFGWREALGLSLAVASVVVMSQGE